MDIKKEPLRRSASIVTLKTGSKPCNSAEATHIHAHAAPSADAACATINRDRAAVLATIHLIAAAADLRQWALVRSCFATEVVLDYGAPEVLTPEAIIQRWRPLLSAFDATEHLITQTDVVIAGADASITSHFKATHLLRGQAGGDIWRLSGRYYHQLYQTSDGWLVTRMSMVPADSTGNATLLDVAKLIAARSSAV